MKLVPDIKGPQGRSQPNLLLDDFGGGDLVSKLATKQRALSDRVMGGVSRERVVPAQIDGRRCLRLTGVVRLDNDGGFIQMALDLAAGVAILDASAYQGLSLGVRGNGQGYDLNLRTPDCDRPWQSYRAGFVAEPRWGEIKLPFHEFAPYRLATPLDVRRLRRLGLVAIGRTFEADLAVAKLALYAEQQ